MPRSGTLKSRPCLPSTARNGRVCCSRRSAKNKSMEVDGRPHAQAMGEATGLDPCLLPQLVPFWDFVRPELRTLLIIACGERSARVLYPSQVAEGLPSTSLGKRTRLQAGREKTNEQACRTIKRGSS